MEQTAQGTFEEKEDKQSKSEEKEEGEKQLFTLEYQREHAVAFLARKMPYHYYVYRRLFHELSERMPDFKPQSALDYGAGLGSGLWAA